jgi:hypothetical protein
LATGAVHSVIFDRLIECPLCKGSKRWPPPDDPELVAYFAFDPFALEDDCDADD